jgi:hypothetical protein
MAVDPRRVDEEDDMSPADWLADSEVAVSDPPPDPIPTPEAEPDP